MICGNDNCKVDVECGKRTLEMEMKSKECKVKDHSRYHEVKHTKHELGKFKFDYYVKSKKIFMDCNKKIIQIMDEYIKGGIVGGSTVILGYPLDTIKTIKQNKNKRKAPER